VPLDRLTPTDIEDWRNGLVSETRTKVTANRIYRSFRAAMNYAFKKKLIAGRRGGKRWHQTPPGPSRCALASCGTRSPPL